MTQLQIFDKICSAKGQEDFEQLHKTKRRFFMNFSFTFTPPIFISAVYTIRTENESRY